MRALFIFLTLILIIPFASSFSMDLGESYKKRETVSLEMSGLLEPIGSANVQFKKGNTPVALDYGFGKVGEKDYFWFIAPQNSGNYTLILKDILVFENGETKIITYYGNVSVGEESASYNVKPGILVANNDFSFSVNSFLSSAFDLSVSFYPENIRIFPGTNTVRIEIEDVEGLIDQPSQIGDYSIPSFIRGVSAEPNITDNSTDPTNVTTPTNSTSLNQTNGTIPGNNSTLGNETSQNSSINQTVNHGKPILIFIPERIQSRILSSKSEASFPIIIFNEGNETAKNVSFDFDDRFFSLVPNFILEIEPNSSTRLNLTVSNLTGMPLIDVIGIEGFDSWIFISINFTANESDTTTDYVQPNSTSREGYSSYYCAELGGDLCMDGEICDSNNVETLDGACCIGTCEEKEEDSWFFTFLGYGVMALVAIILVVFLMKYKKTGTQPGNPLENRVKMIERNP